MSTRKKHVKAFKEQSVLIILSGEKPIEKLSEEIGVHHTTIRDWVQSYTQSVKREIDMENINLSI